MVQKFYCSTADAIHNYALSQGHAHQLMRATHLACRGHTLLSNTNKEQ